MVLIKVKDDSERYTTAVNNIVYLHETNTSIARLILLNWKEYPSALRVFVEK